MRIIRLLLPALLAIGCTGTPERQDLRMLVGTYTEGSGSVGVYLYEFNEDEASYRLLDTAKAGNPSFIVTSADCNFAYSVGEYDDGRQGAYSYSLAKDSIEPLNFRHDEGEHSGAAPCNIVICNGNVITSNYSGGSLSAHPILEDGSLGAMSMQFVPEADSAGAVSHIHCAVLSPEGKYLFVTDLGLDAIYRFTAGGKDCPLIDVKVTHQFDKNHHPGPRHMIFSADGRFAYLLNELSDELTVFAYANGELRHLSTQLAYPGEGHGSADLHLSPDGRFLYTSHRLKCDGISIFSVNKADGNVTPAGFCPTGKHPRNFALSPNGRYLLCACRDADCIEIYEIDNESGALTPTGKNIEVPSPVCVQFYSK